VSRLVFHLVPHTHWDREWYLPEAALRVRLVGMLDDLIARLQRDDQLAHFHFDGQTVLLEDYLRTRPTQAPALAALIRSGRIEVGPWYVLADEQVVSGESLIRNLLVGGRMSERLGRRSGVLYSPDAFGHPAILPDLAREFGLKHAVLWRGVPAAEGVGDGFRWKGPGGGWLFVYHLPPQGYEMGADLPADREALPAAWQRLRAQLLARSSGPNIPVFIGADHHRVHHDLPRLRSLLAALEPGNEVRISRVDAAVAALAGSAGKLGDYTGELRDPHPSTWVLQGTHSTRAPLKRRNSEIEVALERLAAPLVALAGGDDLRASLAFAWTLLLTNHFHDSICGTVSDVVARTMDTRFAAVEAAGKEVARRALHRIVGHDPDRARDHPSAVSPRLVLWNPAVRPRGGVVLARISAFRRDVLVGPPGDRVPRVGTDPLPAALVRGEEQFPLQVIARELTTERFDADRHYPDLDEVEAATVAFAAPELPGMSFITLSTPPSSPSSPFPSSPPRPPRPSPPTTSPCKNDLVKVTLLRSGRLDLVDLGRNERFPGLLEILGVADRGDTYTFCPVGKERVLDPVGPVERRVAASGPLFGALEAAWTVRTATGTIGFRLTAQLFAGSPIVRCKLQVDNSAVDHRLRICLPLGLDGVPLMTGAQFGATERDQHDVEGSPLEAAVTTVPAHRFAAAIRGTRGLAFMAPGFFEAEWLDGDLHVTLLRSVGQLSRNDLDTRSGHAAWPTATPLAQCPGHSTIAFALAPIDGVSSVPGHWEDAFVPLQPVWLRDATDLTPTARSIEVEGEGLVLSTIKPAEEGAALVIRCYNTTGRTVHGTLRFAVPPARLMRARADEREPVATPFSFTAGPHAWVTFVAWHT
jgi:alpha-mannosidase